MPNVIVDIWTRLKGESVDSVDRDIQARMQKAGRNAANAFASEMESANPRIRKAASGVIDSNARVAESNKKLEDANRRVRESTQRIADTERALAESRRTGIGMNEGIALDRALYQSRKDLAEANKEVVRGTGDFERAMQRQAKALRALQDAKLGDAQKRHRHGFGGGQGGNALGGIFTSIPFVPGGKAGAVIGSGLVSVLGSVADAAVTASQSLWLLPAAATAAGAGFLTLKLGMSGFVQALKDSGDSKKFAKDLAGLAPNAQQAALEIQKLSASVGGLKTLVQNSLFRGVAQQLAGLGQAFMPQLKSMTVGIAGAFNQMFQTAAGQLQTPGTSAAINSMIQNITQAFRNLAPAMGPVVDAFARMAKVGSDFLPGMATGIANLAQKFANFIQQAQKSGKLQEWISKGLNAAAELGRVIGEIGHKIFDVFGNKTPDQFKHTLDAMVGSATAVAQAVEGISRVINSLMSGLNPIARELGGWPSLIRDIVIMWGSWKLIGVITQLGQVASLLGVSIPNAAARGASGIAAAFGKGGPAMLAIGALILAVQNLHDRIQNENQQVANFSKQVNDGIKAGKTPDQALADAQKNFSGPSPDLTRSQQGKALASMPPNIIRQTLKDAKPADVAPLLGGTIPDEVWDAMKGKPGWDGPHQSFPTAPGQGPNSKAPSVAPSPSTPNLPTGTPFNKNSPGWYDPFWGKSGDTDLPVPAVPGKGKNPSDKVSLPYDQSFAAPPRPGETQGEYSAEGALMQARHRKAEDEATLLAMEKDNTKTAEQIQAQKNKIIQDQRDINKAQLDLQDAQDAAAKKQLRGLKGLTDGLNDIGPKLDEDFGMSKGLAGLAKNLVEFVASLAAAPLLGKLAAVKAGDPFYTGGYGALGIMAENNHMQGRSGLLGIPFGQPGGPSFSEAFGKGAPSLGSLGNAAISSAAGGNSALTAALLRAGIDPRMIPMLQGFAKTEGNNPSGVPTLGFRDDQAGTTLDQHAQALFAQIQRRQSVAGAFPAGGSPQDQASWMATIVGQNGVGDQPSRQSYIDRIVQGMGQPGAGASPSSLGGSSVSGMGGLNLSTIPVAAQKYANDCIDASARIILSHAGINMSEDQLMGVIPPGGTIESQAAGMNRLDPAGRFMAMPGSGGSPAAMFNAIKASIDNGTGSILNVAPGSSIAGRNFSEGHYIAATGYNPDGSINVSDTAGGKQYSVSAADAFQATRGRGIVVGTGSGPGAGQGLNVPPGMDFGGAYSPGGGAPTLGSGGSGVVSVFVTNMPAGGFTLPASPGSGTPGGRGGPGSPPISGPAAAPPAPSPGGGPQIFTAPQPPLQYHTAAPSGFGTGQAGLGSPGISPGPGGGHPGFPNPGGNGFPGPGPGTPGFPNPGGTGVDEGNPTPVGSKPGGPGGGWQPSGGGGLGIGGMPAAAITSAAGMFPGGGAAAQLAMKLANRTIQQVGEYAAIGVQGLQETFGVHDPDGGGNGLDDIGNNIFGRVLKGLAKAKPATGTSAGKTAGNKDKKDKQGQGQGKPGQQGGPQYNGGMHINGDLNIQQAPGQNPQTTANDVAYMGSVAASTPSMVM